MSHWYFPAPYGAALAAPVPAFSLFASYTRHPRAIVARWRLPARSGVFAAFLRIVLHFLPVSYEALAGGKEKRGKTKADYEAFRKAAGSWKDMDVEKFKADTYASRRLSTRPLVNL